VVLDRDPATSRIYAGFRPGVTAADFRAALAAGTAADTLHAFTPDPGDCVFLRAGTVHAIGADLLIFEVQQTSDITYRLFDWNRVDAKTGKPRELHLDHGLTCSDFAAGPCHPVKPTGGRQELARCEFFTLHRATSDSPLTVGAAGECRVAVGVAGQGELVWAGGRQPVGVGSVVLLPACVGECRVEPAGGPITVLECGLG
jgi:mannose-6-phosphate isomerase